MSMIDEYKSSSDDSYKPQTQEGWQYVTVSDVDEAQQTMDGRDKIVVEVVTRDGFKIRYAYTIISGYPSTNTMISDLVLACGLEKHELGNSFKVLIGKQMQVYLRKVYNEKKNVNYWKIRNFRYDRRDADGNISQVETWYPDGTKKKPSLPPTSEDQAPF